MDLCLFSFPCPFSCGCGGSGLSGRCWGEFPQLPRHPGGRRAGAAEGSCTGVSLGPLGRPSSLAGFRVWGLRKPLCPVSGRSACGSPGLASPRITREPWLHVGLAAAGLRSVAALDLRSPPPGHRFGFLSKIGSGSPESSG